jgi:hypothetical protein
MSVKEALNGTTVLNIALTKGANILRHNKKKCAALE